MGLRRLTLFLLINNKKMIIINNTMNGGIPTLSVGILIVISILLWGAWFEDGLAYGWIKGTLYWSCYRRIWILNLLGIARGMC